MQKSQSRGSPIKNGLAKQDKERNKYYEDLEDRVQRLEKENTLLKIEIDKYKQNIYANDLRKEAKGSVQKESMCKMIDDTIDVMSKCPKNDVVVNACKFVDE